MNAHRMPATAAPEAEAASTRPEVRAMGMSAPFNMVFLALARHGRLSQIRELLATLDAPERCQRLQAQDEHGNTALLLAVAYEYPNVASLLLQFDETEVLHENSRGYTALSLAVRSKRPFVISAVLRRLLGVERLEHGELVTLPMLSQILGTAGAADGGGHHAARNNLIDLYAELSAETISLCVVRAFKRFPGTCLYECVGLAAAVQLRARSVAG
eukprot:2219811-Prymnesium_polylepis.1